MRLTIKMSARAALIWRLDWGWRILSQESSLAWLLALVPHHMGLSFGLLTTWQPLYLRASDLRENQKPQCFQNLAFKVTEHPFCCIQLVTDQPWHNVGGHTYQKGVLLEDIVKAVYSTQSRSIREHPQQKPRPQGGIELESQYVSIVHGDS